MSRPAHALTSHDRRTGDVESQTARAFVGLREILLPALEVAGAAEVVDEVIEPPRRPRLQRERIHLRARRQA